MKYNSILYLDYSDTAYSRCIKKELQIISKRVDCYFYDDIYLPPMFLKRLNPKEYTKRRERSIRLLLDYIKGNLYDIILVKTPIDLPIYFFETLKTTFKNIPIINYNWRSLREFNFLSFREYFTKVYSFDPVDCKAHNLNYYPLFYLRDFENLSTGKKKCFNVSHIGSGHNYGRIEFINQVYNKMTELNLTYFFYLYIQNKRSGLKIKFKYPRLSDSCHFNLLSMNEVLNKFAISESMVDHPMTTQSGLTIRTFETLGSGLHLYTTNSAITQEPFYTPDRITLIDKGFEDFQFINSNEQIIDLEWQASFSKYRIDHWVKRILST